MDRAAQKAGRTFSGIEGIGMQDASLQESMGPIVDRTKENLVSTDNGIIMARHRLLRAVKALVDKGITPPGVAIAHQKVRSAAIVLPPDQPFKDGAREAMIARPRSRPRRSNGGRRAQRIRPHELGRGDCAFRVQAPELEGPRATKVIALDRAERAVVRPPRRRGMEPRHVPQASSGAVGDPGASG